MTLEQVHNLLWWPPNSYKVGDFVAFGPSLVILQSAHRNVNDGNLMYNGSGAFSLNQTKCGGWSTERYLNFTLDVTPHLHLEDIKMDNKSSARRNPLWGKQVGVFADYIVSLRVMGYLIDSWEYSGTVVLTQEALIFSETNKCKHHPPSHPAPIFTASIDETMTESRYPATVITASYPRVGLPNIEFRYTVPRGTDYCAAMRYFNNSPRNFFLSCARANRPKPSYLEEVDFAHTFTGQNF